MSDLLGKFLKSSPSFRGKWRLQRLWANTLRSGDQRIASLPDGSVVEVDMVIPYEQMVWLQVEEWNELRFLQTKLKKDETFIDVGANIGLWTLVAASTVGPNGHVFSYEPNPATFKKLIANIQGNSLQDRITPIQMAVTQSSGSVLFSCPNEHNLSAICGKSPNARTDVIEVDTVALDSLVGKVPIAGMKLDTEGFELDCLKGASRIIQDNSPWLIVEFNTTLLQSSVLAEWNVYHHLRALGYQAFRYDGPNSAIRLEESFSIDGYCNVLFQKAS
jgi:FkbM family methyltransferase